MNDALVSLLNGAGVGDILIPKKDFIREHKHIVGLLNKYNIPELKTEANKQAEELKTETGVDLTGSGSTHRESVLKKYNLADKSYSIDELAKITSVPKSILQEVYNRGVGAYSTQPKSVRLKHSFVKNVDAPMSKKLSKEQWGYARLYSFLNGNPKHDEDLRKNVGGFSKQSGFIRRLMAENALKHKGQYKKPTFPLHPQSNMNEQAEFDYKKIANANQRGSNENEYGASPFIQKHFGFSRAVPFVRKRGVPPPLEPYEKERVRKEKTQETTEQKVARKNWVVPEPTEEMLMTDAIDDKGKPETPNVPLNVDVPIPKPPKAKKLTKAEIKEQERIAAEEERIRLREVRRPKLSEELQKRLTEYANDPKNHGLDPQQLAEKFGWNELNEKMVRHEGLEPGERQGINYRDSGWYKLGNMIHRWIEMKVEDDKEFIPSVALDAIPKVSEKDGKWNWTEKQLKDADYQQWFYNKDRFRQYGPPRGYSDKVSMIPRLLNNIRWSLNSVPPVSKPPVPDKAIIYLLQNKYGFR
jgi:hypothetical protein